MSDTTTATAPLDEVMLAMDVVDTLRHRQDLVNRELSETAREQQLIEKLREIYRQQGIEVTDAVLKQGVSALAESRYVYTPPKPGLGVSLARAYVSRGRWGRWAMAIGLGALLLLGGYFLAYRPYVAGQAEAARLELAERLPAEMDALYDTIFTETKVQQAAIEAEQLVARGKILASEGNREGAQQVIADLTAIRDTLRQEYNLRVANRPDTFSYVWTYADTSTNDNFYVVVEALDSEGNTLTLPILNEETGSTEAVSLWGLRVSEEVYDAVKADKDDDGIIQQNRVGAKQYGFIDVEYFIPTLGGAITQW